MLRDRNQRCRWLGRWAAVAALGAGMLSAPGCAPEKPSKAKLEGSALTATSAQRPQDKANFEARAVAQVNGEAISLGEFNRRVRELPEFARVRYATVTQQQDWLDSVAQFEVMADVAEAKELGKRPEVYFALKQAMADQLLEDVVRDNLAMDDIDDAAIDAYYQAHRGEFEQPAARRVALIEVATREEAAQLRARVLVSMDRAEDSAINAFRRAAAAYSTDREVAQKGGDIGFIATTKPQRAAAGQGETDAASASKRARIAQAVAALEQPGELSEVFALDPGWGLAIFIEERPAAKTPKDQAAAEIRQILYTQRREKIVQDFIAELRDRAQITTFPEVLDALEAPPKPAARDISEITLRKQPAFGVQQP